jgi:hypothetical protein
MQTDQCHPAQARLSEVSPLAPLAAGASLQSDGSSVAFSLERAAIPVTEPKAAPGCLGVFSFMRAIVPEPPPQPKIDK